MKNQPYMTPPKNTDSTPLMDPKEMEIYDLSSKEIKIIIFKNLDENAKEHR